MNIVTGEKMNSFIYNILYKLYFFLQRRERRRKDNRRATSKIDLWLIGQIEAYYNICVKNIYIKENLQATGVTNPKRKQKIIISLTSYPKRINDLWITVETLLRQTMKPDEIVLWLAEDQFEGEIVLPSRLLAQKKRGLTIRWCDNLMSHKKYFYTMQEYPEDLIILVDDDSFYPYDLVELLYKTYKENPNDIVCMTPAIIYPTLESMPDGWSRPKADERILHSWRAQPFSGQGTLFPPGVMPKETFNKEIVMKICPYADDIWLKFMSLIPDIRVTCVYKCRSFPISIYGTAENSLWHINGAEKKNDEQWKAVLNEYENEYIKMKNRYEAK